MLRYFYYGITCLFFSTSVSILYCSPLKFVTFPSLYLKHRFPIIDFSSDVEIRVLTCYNPLR